MSLNKMMVKKMMKRDDEEEDIAKGEGTYENC